MQDPQGHRNKVKTVQLTNRQLTLVRVALIMRLNDLKPKINGDADRQAAYDETRALLLDGGPLSIQALL